MARGVELISQIALIENSIPWGLHRKRPQIYKGRRVKKAACPKRSRIEKGRYNKLL